MELNDIIFGLLGFVFAILVKLIKGGVKPLDFSIKYWINDNLLEALASLISLYVLIYFDRFLMNVSTGLLIPPSAILFDWMAFIWGGGGYSILHDIIKGWKKNKTPV